MRPAGGDVEQVDARCGEERRGAHSVGGRPGGLVREGILEQVARGDAQEGRCVLRDRGVHGGGEREGEARAVREGAAVFVGVLVADGAQVKERSIYTKSWEHQTHYALQM